jgi:hypothetical protein
MPCLLLVFYVLNYFPPVFISCPGQYSSRSVSERFDIVVK